jgi:hypothetical protein
LFLKIGLCAAVCRIEARRFLRSASETGALFAMHVGDARRIAAQKVLRMR